MSGEYPDAVGWRVRGMSESPQATSESAGEGVAVIGVRVSRGRIHARSTDLYERIGPGGRGEVVSKRHVTVAIAESLQQPTRSYKVGWRRNS